jgi:integrase
MSRHIHRLTARKIASAQPPADRQSIMLGDGGNLLLQVSRGKDGEIRRSWIFRYERDGVRHDLGLGSLNTLMLPEARERARSLRIKLLDGVDPAAERRQQRTERLAQQAERARAQTFRWCFEQCLAAHEDGWRNAEHRRQWQTSIETYALPLLGNLPVDEITTSHVVKVLEPIWKEKPETASRVRGRIEKVLGWATVRGFRSGDNPARWRGHLQELFAAKGKIAPVKHLPAMPYSDIPAFLAELRVMDHPAARALEFTTLTAARTSEVLDATWDEFDLTAKVWTIPAARMKAGKEHRVPLSAAALALLSSLPRHDERVFPIGEVAMQKLMKRMRPAATVHGLRSSFRDWASERTSYPPHVAELCLAHSIGNKVEKSYHRSDLFEKRRRLMAEWATWCSRPVPVGATVTALTR